jgi:membrane protein DedA with SNARE-associated domain
MLGDLLVALSAEPLLLALALFAATFVLEDAATVAAGLLTAQTGADWSVALPAVIVGTMVGDLSLYATGRWGAGTKLGRKLRARADVQLAEGWIAGRVLALVFAARFLPGSRLSIKVTSTSARRKPCAAARPPKPAPTITTCGRRRSVTARSSRRLRATPHR